MGRRPPWCACAPTARSIRALTSVSPDTEWAEPKWSRHGDRIAATRWTRGGYTQIVVLDTLGHVVRELTRDRASNSHAEWSLDDAAIVYASDRTGVSQLYAEPAHGDAAAPSIRLTNVTTGMFWPAISPDGASIAAVRWESDGYHVGVAPLGRVLQGPTGGAVRIARADTARDLAGASTDSLPPLASTAPSHGYSPWRSLLPRYWLPLVGQNNFGGYTVGAYTSGSDVVNRHAYAAQVLFDFARAQHTAEVSYSYAGLGQPVLQADVNQYWDAYRAVDSAGSFEGDLFRRTRDFDVGATFSRPRVRTNAFLSVFGTYEARDYTTDPAPLISHIVGLEDPARRYWILSSSAGWTNAQGAALSISPEDGISIGLSGRLKWLDSGGPIASKNISASLSAYKSIDAGGFARHVVAVRAAAGVAGGAEQNEFDLGGASGADIAALPGLSLGSRRTFAVRGFPVGVESGTRIVAGSLEYRLPFTRDQHGFGLWPVFLDRTSLSAVRRRWERERRIRDDGIDREQLDRISRRGARNQSRGALRRALPFANRRRRTGSQSLRTRCELGECVRAARVFVLSVPSFREHVVSIDSSAFIHPLAAIIGDVTHRTARIRVADCGHPRRYAIASRLAQTRTCRTAPCSTSTRAFRW